MSPAECGRRSQGRGSKVESTQEEQGKEVEPTLYLLASLLALAAHGKLSSPPNHVLVLFCNADIAALSVAFPSRVPPGSKQAASTLGGWCRCGS